MYCCKTHRLLLTKIDIQTTVRRGRGRLPVEERVCSCGTGIVQREKLVIEECPKTAHLIAHFNYSSVSDVYEMSDYAVMCKIIHKVLAQYD